MTDLTPNRSSSHDEPPPSVQLEGDSPESQIWKADENAILKSHIQGYRAAGHRKKAPYVMNNVVPEIRATWNGRYDRKELKKNRMVKQEWDKKKQVIDAKFHSRQQSTCGTDEPAVAANFHMVWESCRIQPRTQDSGLQ